MYTHTENPIYHQLSYGTRQENKGLRACAKRKPRFRSPCAYTKYHPGICSPSKHSVASNDSVNRFAGCSGPSLSAICPKTRFLIGGTYYICFIGLYFIVRTPLPREGRIQHTTNSFFSRRSYEYYSFFSRITGLTFSP